MSAQPKGQTFLWRRIRHFIKPNVAVADAKADIAAIKTRSNKILWIEAGRGCCSEQVVAA
jgi:hypothetical protein